MKNIKLKKVAIVYTDKVKIAIEVANSVAQKLAEFGIKSSITTIKNFDNDIDFVVTVGGDGTLLKSARHYSKFSIPVFGINVGKLGFLAQIQKDKLDEAVAKIVNKELKIEKRMMISAQNEEIIALNEFVIKSENFNKALRYSIKINENLICEYLADGLIVSTPTGSTAYNLSSGGPVISPRLEAIVITPICPHTLSARPLVIPSGETVCVFSSDNETNLNLNADGQKNLIINAKEIIEIKKSPKYANLAMIEGKNLFYNVLREKLHWGVAPSV